MDDAEFERRMEAADQKLAADGVPIPSRWFPAIGLVEPNYNGIIAGIGAEGSLPARISAWYGRRYGDRAKVCLDRGRVPVVVRQTVFGLRIPLVYGHPSYNVLNLMEQMTDDLKRTLTVGEQETIRVAFRDGYNLIYDVEDMIGLCLGNPTGRKLFDPDVEELSRRALEDRDLGMAALVDHQHGALAAFHAQQHAEKLLKVVFVHKGAGTLADAKALSHHVDRVWNSVTRFSPHLQVVANDVALLKNVGMDVRYTTPVGVHAAIETYWASIRVGGACACAITGNAPRRSVT